MVISKSNNHTNQDSYDNAIPVLECNHYIDCLLATAVVNVMYPDGQVVQATALIDSGSTCNIVTKKFLNKLKIKLKGPRVNLTSVTNSEGETKSTTCWNIASNVRDWNC